MPLRFTRFPRVRRVVALLGAALLCGVAGQMVANASIGEMEDRTLLQQALDAAFGQEDYDLAQLRLLERTRYFVEDKYVEPERFDPEAMLDDALSFVERQVPEVLFRREKDSRLLHLSVDAHTTTVELGDLRDLEDLVFELRRVAGFLEDHLGADVDRPEIEYALINGMLSSLDPHTILMPPAVSKEMEVENQGEFGGLGITITIDKGDGWLTIEYPLQDTPAYRVGLKARDKILRIEDEATLNMDLEEAVSKLRGKVGDPVTITVDRESFDSPREFTIVRDTIRINPVSGELMEGGIGYIRIKSFHTTTARDLETHLAAFKRGNNGSLKGLVLDLRANPGGYLHQAIEVSDHFLSNGVIVVTVEEGRREEKRARNGNTEPDYPIVVLVNANSASASEIVAGALKRHQRAVIVGDRSFGKGSVQNLYPNTDESRLKLTVAKYLTPGDRSIQSVGISPDIRLVPSVVRPARTSKEGEEILPSVSLFWMDHLPREEDLDRALGKSDLGKEAPHYEVRYLVPIKDEDGPRSDALELDQDWEVQFSRDLLLSVPSARRAEMLQSANLVVERHQRTQERQLAAAFQKVGVDWTAGEQPSQPDLKVTLDLGEDGVADAALSEDEIARLTVTNNSDTPIHRVLARSESSLDWLDGQEYYFGRLEPGETREWVQPIRRIDGFTDQVAQVTFSLQDGWGKALGSVEKTVRLVGQPLPEFAFTFAVIDGGEEGTRGNGDGRVDLGEQVILRATVRNVGKGDSLEGFAKIKNRSGKRVDLQVGRVMMEPLSSAEEVAADFRFEVREGSEPLAFEFSVGENTRYDYNAILQGGFYDYHAQTMNLELPLGEGVPAGMYSPPSLEISRSPGLVVSSPRAVVSGLVRDDRGVRDVMVYMGEEKIFYQGGGAGVAIVPFSVEQELVEGQNLFVVIARDGEGLTDIQSLNVWYDPTGSSMARSPEAPEENEAAAD
jgi:carboxyl-terminal processing protease